MGFYHWTVTAKYHNKYYKNELISIITSNYIFWNAYKRAFYLQFLAVIGEGDLL